MRPVHRGLRVGRRGVGSGCRALRRAERVGAVDRRAVVDAADLVRRQPRAAACLAVGVEAGGEIGAHEVVDEVLDDQVLALVWRQERAPERRFEGGQPGAQGVRHELAPQLLGVAPGRALQVADQHGRDAEAAADLFDCKMAKLEELRVHAVDEFGENSTPPLRMAVEPLPVSPLIPAFHASEIALMVFSSATLPGSFRRPRASRRWRRARPGGGS